MKTILVLALLCIASAAFAQQHSLNWFTADGGGGTSTGGVFSISGTIGRPDAGGAVMNGGPYSVVGGFWALPGAIQTPEAPTLFIAGASPDSIRISWAPPTPGFTLQFSDSLPQMTWTNASSGTNNPAVVPTTQSARFYRLFKP